MPEAIQKILQQIRSFWQKLSTSAKFLLIGTTLLTIAVLLWAIFTVPKPEMSVLFSNLSAKDASLIVQKLEEKQIPYQLEDNGTTILVPKEHLYKLRLDLAQEGLPESSIVGYEIFDKTNLGMSEFVQKLNYRRALEGELARTIASLDEIEKARVHLVIPERRLFESQQKEPTASVVIHLRSNRMLRPNTVSAIQYLVASSVEGLSPENVTVVDNRGKVLSQPSAGEDKLHTLTATQYEIKEKVDQYLTNKVQTILDQVLGIGNAVVQVNADLDFTQKEQTIERYDPAGQVIRSQQTINEQSQSQDSLNYPAVNSASTRTNTITNYEVSREIQRITGEIGQLKRLTVSALINWKPQVQTTEGGETTVQYVPRTDAELQQLEQIIRDAIGYDPNRNDRISVVSMEFEATKELPPTPPPLAPEEIIEKILLVLVMLLVLFALWRLLNSPMMKQRLELLTLPMDIEQQRIELTKALAERQRALLDELTKEFAVPALPEPQKTPELIATIEELEKTPGEILREEIHHKVKRFLSENPEQAARLIRSMLQRSRSS